MGDESSPFKKLHAMLVQAPEPSSVGNREAVEGAGTGAEVWTLAGAGTIVAAGLQTLLSSSEPSGQSGLPSHAQLARMQRAESQRKPSPRPW